MTNSFRIVLTRKNLDSTNDDVIRVTVDSYDEFTVRYTDKTSKDSKFEMAFDWDALLEYFDSLKYMLSLDVEPFADVQIQIPGFPVIALNPHDFANQETHDIFVDIVERYVTQVTNKAKYVAPEDWDHDKDCCPYHE